MSESTVEMVRWSVARRCERVVEVFTRAEKGERKVKKRAATGEERAPKSAFPLERGRQRSAHSAQSRLSLESALERLLTASLGLEAGSW